MVDFPGLSPALTGSYHPVSKTGYAHWLQLNPALSVGVVEWTHATRHSSRRPVSVQKNKQTGQDASRQHDLGELSITLISSRFYSNKPLFHLSLRHVIICLGHHSQ